MCQPQCPPNCYWSWGNLKSTQLKAALFQPHLIYLVGGFFGVEFQRFSAKGIDQIIRNYVRHRVEKKQSVVSNSKQQPSWIISWKARVLAFADCLMSVVGACCVQMWHVESINLLCHGEYLPWVLEIPKSTKRSEMFSLSGNESIFHQTGKRKIIDSEVLTGRPVGDIMLLSSQEG